MESFKVGLESSVTVSGKRYVAATGDVPALVVLAHGAGAGQDHPFMVASAGGLAARGLDAVTFNFPYMERRAGAPNPAPQLERCYREVIAALASRGWLERRALIIGGKSMGGRMASHLAAEPESLPHPIAGLVFLGYPLHPPGNPAKARTAHLPRIQAPMLFVQGTRDTFGSPGELAPVVATLPAKVTVHAIDGGDHSFKVTGGGKAAQGQVLEGILDVVAQWVRGVASKRPAR
jgi:predicted alpha/beta-hydrolase family hydrolase